MAVVYKDRIAWGVTDSDSVRAIQTALNKVSFPPHQNIGVDGNYDWPTFNMVKAFQKFIGDAEDGYLGPRQTAELFRRAGMSLDWRDSSSGSAAPQPAPAQAPAATGNISTPFPGAVVGTRFGVPGAWAAKYHTGRDYPCPVGTPLRSTWTAKVVATNAWGSAYGNHVIMEHTSGGVTHRIAYCHMSRIDVRVGDSLVPGTHVGLSGNTGNTTGPHVHVEDRTYPFGYANRVADPAL